MWTVAFPWTLLVNNLQHRPTNTYWDELCRVAQKARPRGVCALWKAEFLHRLASIHTHASWANARTLTHNRARCVDVSIRPRGFLAAAPLFLHTSPSAMHSCKLVPCMTSLTVPAAHLNMTAKAAHRMTPTAGISRVSVYAPLPPTTAATASFSFLNKLSDCWVYFVPVLPLEQFPSSLVDTLLSPDTQTHCQFPAV